jgi:F-type H+-transporting ATPase subunit delta
MIEGSLSRRYSKALFELARETGDEERLGDELKAFLSAHNESSLRAVLSNPAFRLDSRKKILLGVTKNLQLSVITENLFVLLLERDRLDFVPSIVASYRRLLNEAKGRVEAKVIAPTPLQPALFDGLRASLCRLSGKDVILEEQGDPELIGGLVVELEGKIFDGSVRTQLENMKQRIARGF